MRVLLTGASGFIGGHILQGLLRDGHRVVAVSRRKPSGASEHLRFLPRDFAESLDPADWAGAVQDIDAVINAVGILREHGTQRFDRLHHRAPSALFQAAVAAGVGRIVQVSALGADEEAVTGYHLSKKAADDTLLAMPVEAVVVQPSVVIGLGGAATAMFTMQAKLPFTPIPGTGQQLMQPIHVDDLAELVVALATNDALASQYKGRRVAAVGPEPMNLREFYARLRCGLGLESEARFIGIPMWYMNMMAQAGKWIPGSPLDPDTLSMLERGTSAPADDTRAILGREPRAVESFFEPTPRAPS